jgi:hypothetical protein
VGRVCFKYTNVLFVTGLEIHVEIQDKKRKNTSLKGNFAIFYMLAKYVPGDIKYIFTKIYRHISTNNEANRSKYFSGNSKYPNDRC